MSHILDREDVDMANDAWGFNCGPAAIERHQKGSAE
jgi:hypothetical protein